jgi:transcriptional regulator with XRE-family HTH domain
MSSKNRPAPPAEPSPEPSPEPAPPRPTASGGDDLGAAELARRVADNLRRLRHDRRLSLDQLASASGVSRAALSQIEGARTNPTLGVLWKIAVGLGVPFQGLVGTESEGRFRLLRGADVAPLRTPDGRIESRLLTPAGSNIGVEVYELRFQARGVLRSDAHSSGTTETLLLLTGALRLSVDEEACDLLPGDTLFFRADVAHTYENRSTHEARCIDIIAYGRAGA